MSGADSLEGSSVSSNEKLTIDASIIVVSYNTRELLRECLASTLAECADLDAEIIVVDNGSTDGSIEMVERGFPQVELVRSPINLGFGVANNVALKRARGRYLVLLNSDAFFTPGALSLAIRHMEETPSCGLAGGLLTGRDGEWQPSAKVFHSILEDLIVLTGLADKFPRSRIFGRMNRTWADQSQPAQVDWVPGAFAIIRRSALERVGMFDPIFFLYYEEVDLCRRIKEAGMQVWYWPDVVVLHLGGQSSKKLTSLEFSEQSAQVVLWRMRSTLLYYRKHHGRKVWLAKWMEKTLYRLTVVRNRWSASPERRERGQRHRAMIGLMDQAWRETRGGRISPPHPW